MKKNKKKRNAANANPKYKDTVFRLLFGDNRDELLNLYNAVNDSHYTDSNELVINTLKDAIYCGMRNDVSFVFQDCLNLYEHQSTVNPNLPLRDLFYVADLLQVMTAEENLYGSKRVKIPTPKFLVFYNGEEETGTEKYCLSDMYVKQDSEPELDLVVRIINVNYGSGTAVLEKCKTLSEYAEFVAIVRKNRQEMPLREAVTRAVDDCIKRDILRGFLINHKAQVIKMSIYEFDAEKQRVFDREEGREEGSVIRLIVQIQKKVDKSKSLNVIADELESDEVEIRPLYEAVLKYGADARPEEVLQKMKEENERNL
ncbi:MAG: hypothetical protein K6G83_08030 [Lachnospiraceae bacterium]|nr:hypothetical protein [Lachnospiraceae bacterium]